MDTDSRRWIKLLSVSFCVHLWFNTSSSYCQLSPPALRSNRPVALLPGESAALEIRGQGLEGASAVLFSDPRLKAIDLQAAKDQVQARLELPKDLPPGPIRYRVAAPNGLSNPGVLYVDRPSPIVAESEPNNGFRRPQVIHPPAAIHGSIDQGNDVDVFALDMKAGESIVAEAIAARGGSGLDPLLTIFTPDGRELAAVDDLFGRDAAAWAVAPRDGRYFVQVQDANGRHRDNNVEQRVGRRDYRLNLGKTLPIIASAFPPGARRGTSTELRLAGVNLPDDGRFRLDVPADAPLGDFALNVPSANAWNVRVGDAPEFIEPEIEPSDDPLRATIVEIPAAINGCLVARDGGDLDLYRLRPAPGREGDYAINVLAARVGSPADPFVAVLDEKGASQGEDDDKLGRDARIERAIGPDGVVIAVRDYFNRGGPRFAYRIEVEPVARLRITADLGLKTLPRKGGLAIPLTLDRRGFEGPVTVLAGPLPPGVSAAPTTLPAKAKAGVLVLSANADATLGAFPLRLEVRDVPVSADVAYRERWLSAEGPREAAVEGEPLLAVAEPIPLGPSIEPAEIVIVPGGQAEIRVMLDRRSEAAKKPIRARLLSVEGGLDGLDGPREINAGADAGSLTFTLRARPDAAPRRLTLGVRVWYDGLPDLAGADATPAVLLVPERP